MKIVRKIGDFHKIIKAVNGQLLYTCSTGWRGGFWAKNNQIGLEHLDFVEVHHYSHHHGDPWSKRRDESLHGLEKLEKPVLIGEYHSDDFDLYTKTALKKGFLGAAPLSIRHDFPISETTWQNIRDFAPPMGLMAILSEDKLKIIQGSVG